MSPYIRSMLDDAADDSGRPATTDLQQIRSAGRRAVWRRRGLVGAGAVGVVAVVTSIALVLPSLGGTPTGPAGSGDSTNGSEPANGAPLAASWGLSPALDPLFEAIRAAGYEIGAYGSHGMSGMSGSSEGSAGSVPSTEMLSMTTTSLPVTKDDAVGSLIVAEFTDVKMLDPGGGAGLDPQCAISPRELGSIDFTWSECDKESSGEVQVWRGSGGGSEGDAIGVTAVRADFSGVSVTLSTAADGMVVSDYDLRSNPDSGSSWFGYNTPPAAVEAVPAPSLTVPETVPDRTELPLPEMSPVDELAPSEPVVLENLPALSELPFTVDALAEFVVNIAASGAVFSEAISEDGANSDGLPPPPNDPAHRAACIEGEVLTEMVDDAGRSALVQAADRIYACSWGVKPDELVDVMDVTDWTTFGDELEAWQFNLGYLTKCERFEADGELQECPEDVRMGVGPVPDGVARISYELADGQVLDAQMAAGFWIFRTLPPADRSPFIVRVYDADGAVLVEGDINDEHPPMPTEWPEPPPGPPPLESPAEPVPDDEGTAKP